MRKPNRSQRLEKRNRNRRLTSGERRALARGVLIEKISRKRLLKLHKGKCGICGERVNPRKFEIDHVIPLSRGGTHQYSNCQPAHKDCNKIKADKMPGEVIIPFRKKSRKSKGFIHTPRPVRAAA